MAAGTDIKDSILETVGDTPLIRLSRIAAGLTPGMLRLTAVVSAVRTICSGGPEPSAAETCEPTMRLPQDPARSGPRALCRNC